MTPEFDTIEERPRSRFLEAYAKAAARAQLEAMVETPQTMTPASIPAPRPLSRAVVQRPVSAPRRRRRLTRRAALILGIALPCAASLMIWWVSSFATARSEPARAASSVVLPPQTEALTRPAPPPTLRATLAPTEVVLSGPPTSRVAVSANPTSRVAVASKSKVAEPPAVRPPTTPSTEGVWLSPRLAKLGIKPSWKGSAIGVDDPALVHDLQQALSELWVNHAAINSDVIFLGVHQETDIDRIETLRPMVKRGGILWVLCRTEDAALAASAGAAARAVQLTPGRRVALSAAYTGIAFTN